MMFFRVLMMIALGVSGAGCVLPIPHERLQQYGVVGKVVEKSTGRPLEGVRVVPVDRSQVCETDAKGGFVLPPVRTWHGAYLLGPVSYSLFPTFDTAVPRVKILVVAPGFKGRTLPVETLLLTRRDYLDAGSIALGRSKKAVLH